MVIIITVVAPKIGFPPKPLRDFFVFSFKTLKHFYNVVDKVRIEELS